jgi:ubiquinone/menaquinone biosynthesis C-methylase UbiE
MKMFRKIYHSFFTKKLSPSKAYNILSKNYDNELNNGNITVFYNSLILNKIFHKLDFYGKTILDIGAGTGTNYSSLIDCNPEKYIACDVSKGMLEKFISKHPEIESFVVTDEKLPFIENNSTDIILSSLMIGYVKDLSKTFEEWNRVIKPGGHIIISFLSPNLSGKSTSRSFKNGNNKTLFIENYKHDVKQMKQVFSIFHWEVIDFLVEKVDMRSIDLFKKRKKENLFKEFEQKEIICAFILKK